ncbi:MAG: TIGR04255 family protein [Actinomycetota bacterium]
MVLGLPSPNRQKLPFSPLELTVCQVRFEETLAIADAKLILAIRDRLGGESRYPRLEQEQPSFQVAVSAQGAPTQPLMGQVFGWKLQSADATWRVSIMPTFVALETTDYDTWEDFGPQMGVLLDATAELISPALEQRLGLRYIDRLRDLQIRESKGWADYVTSPLSGILMHESLGPAVATSQQQALLDLGGELKCLLRHGQPEGDDHTYVLDYDIFRQSARPFDASTIKTALRQFSDAALQLFHASLNPDYLARLLEGKAS